MKKFLERLSGLAAATALWFACMMISVQIASGEAWAFDGIRASTGEAPGEAIPKRISMGAGKSSIVELPRDVSEIVIGNPKVVDAVVRTPRKIYVMGFEAGQSSILGLDAQGREVARLEISIGRDVGQLNALLHVALPGSPITAQTVNDTIILTGNAASASEAQRAIDIAKGFVSRGTVTGSGCTGDACVINAMTLKGKVRSC